MRIIWLFPLFHFANSQAGSALHFDGVNDIMSIFSDILWTSSETALLSGEFTIETWLKLGSPSTKQSTLFHFESSTVENLLTVKILNFPDRFELIALLGPTNAKLSYSINTGIFDATIPHHLAIVQNKPSLTTHLGAWYYPYKNRVLRHIRIVYN